MRRGRRRGFTGEEMKLTIDGQSFSVELENNALGESVRAMCPVTLDMSRSGEREYYAAAPKKAAIRGAAETAHVKRDCVYYFAAWNALALAFRDAEIAPYKVHFVGRAEGISELLEHAGGALRVTLEE